MDYHRWTSVDGSPMTTVDVKAYKSKKCRSNILRSIKTIFNRLILPNSTVGLLLTVGTLIAAQVYA